MNNEHFVGRVGVRAIIERGGKVLITKDSLDDIWEIPGGRLHIGESVEECLSREIKEELGVHLKIGQLIYSGQYTQARDGNPHLMLVYRGDIGDALINPDAREVSEVLWIGKHELDKQKIYENCLKALRKHFRYAI